MGTPYAQRALPYIQNGDAYHAYEVIKPINNVSMGEIASAFNQAGGGIQFQLPSSVKDLITGGFLHEVTTGTSTINVLKNIPGTAVGIDGIIKGIKGIKNSYSYAK